MQLSKSYQLIRKLASGGMAEVFLARTEGPLGFSKTLVLKRILPHLADDEQFVEMFLGEARLVAQLSHPNVVHIFDFGEFEGSYYIAMEYIDGPNLRVLARQARIAGEELAPVLCAKIISYACEGLAYAHDLVDPRTGKLLGLVHRDISSDNILVSRTGTVKVVDFGVAKVIGQDHRTKAGTIKGKLPYMSPEQIRGRPLDRRADVYALGVVLYELLAHQRPFDATGEAAIMNAVLSEPMTPLRERRPDIPEALVRITERCLAKEREERFPSCRHLRTELERFIHGTEEPVGTDELASLVARLMPVDKGASARAVPARQLRTPPQVARAASAPASGPRAVGTRTPSPGAPTLELERVPQASSTLLDLDLAVTVPRSPTGTHAGRAGSIAVALGCLTVLVALGAFLVLRRSPAAPMGEEPPLLVEARPASDPEPPRPAPKEPPSQPTADAGTETTAEAPAIALKPAAPVDASAVAHLKQDGEKKKRPPPTDRSASRLAIAMEAVTREAPEEAPETPEVPQSPQTHEASEPHEAPKVTAPPAEPLPLASVVFESSPPAQIRVNGQFVGFESVTSSRLPPGPVQVEVYDSVRGFRKKQTFTLVPGDNGVKRVLVEQGSLALQVHPSARVYVDGKFLGLTPLKNIPLFEGTHELRLENKELGKTTRETVTIQPHQPLTREYNLEASP